MIHFDLLIWPLLACISMGLLHGYCGLHVLRRGVIFVDLALAQMAALGAVVGLQFAAPSAHHVIHMHKRKPPAAVTAQPTDSGDAELDQAVSRAVEKSVPPAAPDEADEAARPTGMLDFWPTAFALGGALLLAFGRVPGDRVPHEAIIGIVYVVATAASVIILSNSPHGHEEMDQMLSGKLLFVDRDEVLTTAAMYAVLGFWHWLFRRQILAVSTDSEAAAKAGMNVRLWDCLFYGIFALMVTRSVAVGGVLVVFSFLIIPGACAAMFVDSFRGRVLVTWLVATMVSVVGVIISDKQDWPTGPTMVATYGVAMIISVISAIIRRRSVRVVGFPVVIPAQEK